jgi:hypothetical protein
MSQRRRNEKRACAAAPKLSSESIVRTMFHVKHSAAGASARCLDFLFLGSQRPATLCGEIVSHHHAALHNEFDALHFRNILQRIS